MKVADLTFLADEDGAMLSSMVTYCEIVELMILLLCLEAVLIVFCLEYFCLS